MRAQGVIFVKEKKICVTTARENAQVSMSSPRLVFFLKMEASINSKG
jgi:hypothetical protein